MALRAPPAARRLDKVLGAGRRTWGLSKGVVEWRRDGAVSDLQIDVASAPDFPLARAEALLADAAASPDVFSEMHPCRTSRGTADASGLLLLVDEELGPGRRRMRLPAELNKKGEGVVDWADELLGDVAADSRPLDAAAVDRLEVHVEGVERDPRLAAAVVVDGVGGALEAGGSEVLRLPHPRLMSVQA